MAHTVHIALGGEYGRGLFVVVDLADYNRLSKYSWSLNNYGYVRARVNTNGVITYPMMHRMIMGEVPQGLEIDHIDKNKLNNTRDNLRIVTRLDNMHNRPKSRKNTSGVTGVSWYSCKQKWVAVIHVNNRKINLGSYHSKEEAIAARRAAEIVHGFTND